MSTYNPLWQLEQQGHRKDVYIIPDRVQLTPSDWWRQRSSCLFIVVVVWLQLPTLEMSEYWNWNTDRLMFSQRRLQMSQRNTLLEWEYGFLEIRLVTIWPKHPAVWEVAIVLTSCLCIQSTRSRRTPWRCVAGGLCPSTQCSKKFINYPLCDFTPPRRREPLVPPEHHL